MAYNEVYIISRKTGKVEERRACCCSLRPQTGRGKYNFHHKNIHCTIICKSEILKWICTLWYIYMIGSCKKKNQETVPEHISIENSQKVILNFKNCRIPTQQHSGNLVLELAHVTIQL